MESFRDASSFPELILSLTPLQKRRKSKVHVQKIKSLRTASYRRFAAALCFLSWPFTWRVAKWRILIQNYATWNLKIVNLVFIKFLLKFILGYTRVELNVIFT